MTAGSSMPASTLSLTPRQAEAAISIPNTRFRRLAQLIATWRGVGGLAESAARAVDFKAPVPGCAGVMTRTSRKVG